MAVSRSGPKTFCMTSLRWSVENSRPPCHTFLIHANGLGTTLLRTLQLCGQAFGGNPTSSPSPRRHLRFPTFCDPATTPDNLQVGCHGTGGELRGRRDGLRSELRLSCPPAASGRRGKSPLFRTPAPPKWPAGPTKVARKSPNSLMVAVWQLFMAFTRGIRRRIPPRYAGKLVQWQYNGSTMAVMAV